MRKRLVPHVRSERVDHPPWLDLAMVTAEITSEDPNYPIECALLADDERGWRAGEPGEQRLRLLFDRAQDISQILLEFVESNRARTQEFVLRWSRNENTAAEIARQQWNFSPAGSVRETEHYQVQLTGARMLELTVNPDISGSSAYASLRRLRLA